MKNEIGPLPLSLPHSPSNEAAKISMQKKRSTFWADLSRSPLEMDVCLTVHPSVSPSAELRPYTATDASRHEGEAKAGKMKLHLARRRGKIRAASGDVLRG